MWKSNSQYEQTPPEGETCEECGERFVVIYGERLRCPECGSTKCTDQFDDWEWW